MKKLTENEITVQLQKLRGWSYSNNTLEKTFRFKNFIEAFGFMSSVALIAEKLNHHPDWSNVYNKVTLRMSTHDAGGVTEKDFDFVKLVESVGNK